ncbi:MAG: SH3 domain-containing protein, partial [Lachnospiraceae bacterium]|nr:SH3 domain-containing protein [Lachnospiraceae bacterium]
MKKSRVLRNRWKAIVGAFVLTAMLTAGLAADAFAITSYAASAGKVVANSAKIRKDASTSSESVGSAAKGTAITITGQTTGSDGNTWYQVTVDANTTGYIRSDLVEITDGSTPGTVVAATTTTTTTSSTPTTSTPDENIVEVMAVEPVSANVSGTSPVRVRQNASTTSRIVSTAQGGLALTVNGTANGTDGNEWYQVTFISNGSEVNGFIRASYVKLNGELVPAGSTEAEQPQESTETQPQETTETATTTTTTTSSTPTTSTPD